MHLSHMHAPRCLESGTAPDGWIDAGDGGVSGGGTVDTATTGRTRPPTPVVDATSRRDRRRQRRRTSRRFSVRRRRRRVLVGQRLSGGPVPTFPPLYCLAPASVLDHQLRLPRMLHPSHNLRQRLRVRGTDPTSICALPGCSCSNTKTCLSGCATDTDCATGHVVRSHPPLPPEPLRRRPTRVPDRLQLRSRRDSAQRQACTRDRRMLLPPALHWEMLRPTWRLHAPSRVSSGQLPSVSVAASRAGGINRWDPTVATALDLLKHTLGSAAYPFSARLRAIRLLDPLDHAWTSPMAGVKATARAAESFDPHAATASGQGKGHTFLANDAARDDSK